MSYNPDEHKFNYGPVYLHFSKGWWCQGRNRIYKDGSYNCMCLATAINQFYIHSPKWSEARQKTLEAIIKLFPERTSQFASKLASVKEPMTGERYSLVAFNDNPKTTLEDVMAVVIEAGV